MNVTEEIFIEVKPRAQSYIQNSRVDFYSTLELTNQISYVINFSFSDWSIVQRRFTFNDGIFRISSKFRHKAARGLCCQGTATLNFSLLGLFYKNNFEIKTMFQGFTTLTIVWQLKGWRILSY